MSRDHRLKQLLQNPHIWRSGQFCLSDRQPCATGFATLDQWIGGGWPRGVLTEFLLDAPGIGELGLVMPAMACLCPDLLHQDQDQLHINKTVLQAETSRSGWGVFIASPHIPYAPALAGHGLDISRLLVVDPESSADALWVMEQALRSGIFTAVFGWFADIDTHALRRLQLAAEAGMCWASIYRPARFASTASPAALRIHIEPGKDETLLHILRNRYGPVGSLSVRC
jgi:cell division inhibitor SulA